MEHVEVRRLITKTGPVQMVAVLMEICPLDAEVDFLPNVHGSGLFTRGQRNVKPFLS